MPTRVGWYGTAAPRRSSEPSYPVTHGSGDSGPWSSPAAKARTSSDPLHAAAVAKAPDSSSAVRVTWDSAPGVSGSRGAGTPARSRGSRRRSCRSRRSARRP
ncbi:hypothetical protein ABZ917_27865 [Nonomuraea wenchangensis]